MLRYVAPLVILACADPSRNIAVDRVVPGQGDVGVSQPVTIEGAFNVLSNNLDHGDTVMATVRASVDTMALPDATWIAQDQITVTMPGLPAGAYDVTVSIGGRTGTLSDGYIVGSGTGSDGGMLGPGTYSITVVGPVTDGPHADFPLLVDIVDAKLRTTANGGAVASDDGFDIFFSLDPAGMARLSHELEKYAGANGELVAWVKVPSLDTNTTLFIHVGDPTIVASQEDVPGVWTAGFRAVYHLSDAMDSTGNNNNGTDSGTAAEPDGQIEGARDFNGSTSRITVPQATSIDNLFAAPGGTVAAWVLAETAGSAGVGRVFEKATIVRMGNCEGAGYVNSFFFTHEFTGNPGTWCTPVNSIAAGAWSYVAVVYSKESTANTPTIYVNGVAQTITQVDSASGAAFSDAVGPLVIGNRAAGSRAFDGQIDELTYARATRTSGWIKTSFDNQRDPSSFVILGP